MEYRSTVKVYVNDGSVVDAELMSRGVKVLYGESTVMASYYAGLAQGANDDAQNAASVAVSAEEGAMQARNDLLSQKGQPNGIVPLNSSAEIPSQHLPSYVDDVIEVANLASLPAEGEQGKIYITLDDNHSHRWTGSVYVDITEANALSESDVKALYESNPDTNAFTDAEQSKLEGVEAGATADQTAEEIKTLYESNTDTNALTDALLTILSAIQGKASLAEMLAGSAVGKWASPDLVHAAFKQYGIYKPISLANASVDDAITANFYVGYGGLHASASTGDNPFPTSGTPFSMITTGLPFGLGAGYISQTAALLTTSGVFKKTRAQAAAAGGWGDWSEEFHQENIVGTVSQSGGVPTGSIFQRGSTPTGEFVKLADGTLEMIIEGTLDISAANTLAVQLALPSTLIGTAKVFTHAEIIGGSVSTGDYGRLLTSSRVISTTHMDFRVRHMQDTAITEAGIPYKVYVKGRWY